MTSTESADVAEPAAIAAADTPEGETTGEPERSNS